MKTQSINSRGKIIDVEIPIVMGILNATPDSFYNKGRENSLRELVNKAKRMCEDGASILDIGGMSTRPGADEISVEEEIQRVLPIIESIKNEIPDMLISIDTYRSEVAQKAIQYGAGMINDISGSQFDEGIIDVAIENKATYICMHIQGTPQTMQKNPQYTDITKEISSYFQQKLSHFAERGLTDVIIDPGFGFGKTIEHNFKLLNSLSDFEALGKPILVGLSRKSMVYKPLHTTSEYALNGTTALNMIALQNGANILRVHDVKEAMECILLHQQIVSSKKI